MNQTKREKWKKVRAKGKSEFILKDGGLIFGLLFFGVVFPTLRLIVEFFSNDYTFSFFNKSFQVSILFNLIIAFPLGCLFGSIMWYLNEFSYSRSSSVK